MSSLAYSTLNPYELKLIRSLNTLNGKLKRAANLDRLMKSALIEKDGFVVHLNVEHFKPEDITVTTVDSSIIIEAKCEWKSEHEYVSSQYRRRYELPDGFRTEDVTCSMSSDGILTIKCPEAHVDKTEARQIEIKQTGPAKPKTNEVKESTNEKNEQTSEAYQCRMF